jgi:hypothetical protein
MILKTIGYHRNKNKNFDFDVAMQTYYNDDITQEEKMRRWYTLELEVSEMAIVCCNQLRRTPWPESWHSLRNCRYTKEMISSIDDNWWDKVEAIEHIPDLHVEKRRQAFAPFWKEQRRLGT